MNATVLGSTVLVKRRSLVARKARSIFPAFIIFVVLQKMFLIKRQNWFVNAMNGSP